MAPPAAASGEGEWDALLAVCRRGGGVGRYKGTSPVDDGIDDVRMMQFTIAIYYI